MSSGGDILLRILRGSKILLQVLCKWINGSLKKEDPFDKDNYWSISILPLISKVFQKIMHIQVYSYIQQYLNLVLCAFRQGQCTQHACFRLQKEHDDSSYTGTVLMDLSKAYGCIPHELLKKFWHIVLTTLA